MRRRQKEKQINPPLTSSGGPVSPASPPSMASPGGFLGAQPGGSTTPPTPYLGTPGKNSNIFYLGSFLDLFAVLWGPLLILLEPFFIYEPLKSPFGLDIRQSSI